MPIKVIEPVRMMTLADYYKMIDNIYNKELTAYAKRIADQIMYGNHKSMYEGLI
jgi:hypothetical protein